MPRFQGVHYACPLIYFSVLLGKVLVGGIPVWVDHAGLGGFWEVELLMKVLFTDVAINYKLELPIYLGE